MAGISPWKQGAGFEAEAHVSAAPGVGPGVWLKSAVTFSAHGHAGHTIQVPDERPACR